MKRTYTVYDWFAHFLPCLVWLRTYKLKEYLYRDVLAGLSVAAMVVPQGEEVTHSQCGAGARQRRCAAALPLPGPAVSFESPGHSVPPHPGARQAG